MSNIFGNRQPNGPRDGELLTIANRWLDIKLEDDGNDLQHDLMLRYSFPSNPPKHVRFFYRRDKTYIERYGVYFRLRGRQQWWIAYALDGQTAARLADAFMLHFWSTRIRIRNEVEPHASRFNFSKEQALEDSNPINEPEVARWLTELNDLFMARGVFHVEPKAPAAPRVPRLRRMEEMLSASLDMLAKLTHKVAELEKKLVVQPPAPTIIQPDKQAQADRWSDHYATTYGPVSST